MVAKEKRPAPDKWELQDATRTMARAHGIRNDKHMMRHLKKHVRKHAAAMNSLAQAMQSGGGMDQMAGATDQAPESLDQAFSM